MNQGQSVLHASTHNRWTRFLYMLFMALAYQVVGTLVFVVTVIQFVVVLVSDEPNARLVSFGRRLARYMEQIVSFLTFASETIPFPFSDWPSAE